MRKYTAFFLGILLLAALTACGGPASASAQGETVKMTELYSEEGSGTDGYGEPIHYSFHVPQIDEDTPDALAINTDIKDICTAIVGYTLDSVRSGEQPDMEEIAYESFQNGPILSLLMRIKWHYSMYTDYYVYNYDAGKSVWLDNAALLKQAGISEEDFLTAARRAAAQHFDDAYWRFWLDPSVENFMPGYFLNERLRSVSSECISMDTPLYLDGTGTPCILPPLWTPAGGGVEYEPLPLELPTGTEKPQTVSNPLVEADWSRTGVTLRFPAGSQQAWEQAGYASPTEYGTDIPVPGLWSNYVQACLGDGPDGPVLYLITDRGRVEYVDIGEGVKSGYFCGSAPLSGCFDAVGFEEDESGLWLRYSDMEIESLLSILVQSERENNLPDAFQGTWNFTQEEEGEDYGMRDSSTLTVNSLQDVRLDCYSELNTPSRPYAEERHYQGVFTYLGMTEEGLAYYYDLTNESFGCRGVSAFRVEYDQDYMEELYVKTLAVDANAIGIFSGEPGTVIRAKRTFG